MEFEPTTTQFVNEHSTIKLNWPNDWAALWEYLYGALTVFYHHVTYAFQRESTLYSSLNVKELLVGNRHDISSLSGSNGIRTHNDLVYKRTLNHLPKLAN